MKHKIYWALAAIMALCAACENNLPLDSNIDNSRLALNGFIDADSLENELLVSLTDDTKPQPVSHAVVEVSVNGEKRAVASELEYPKGTYRFSCKFQPGEKVRIDVTTSDGEHHAYVEETIPQPIEKIESAEAKLVKNAQFFTNTGFQEVKDMHQFKLSFTDNGTTTDYYRLGIKNYTVFKFTQQSIFRDSTMVSYHYYRPNATNDYICTGDPIMMEGKTFTPSTDIDFATMNNIPNEQGVFNDLLFNGTRCNISVYQSYSLYEDKLYENEYEKTEELYSIYAEVIIYSFTPTAYYYLKAVNFLKSSYYDDNSDLTGPLKLPTNVHGGAGMVGFFTSKSAIIKIKGNDPYPGLY